MNLPWSLDCSACGHTRDADGIPGVCEKCGQPYLVRFAARPPPEAKRLLRDRRTGRHLLLYRSGIGIRNGTACGMRIRDA